jgi:type III secretion system FlhB-like substrate exporter
MNQELKRQAVASRYEPKKEAAPRLVTKRRGYLTAKILELVRLYDIPIRQDKKLLQILSRLDLEEENPAGSLQTRGRDLGVYLPIEQSADGNNRLKAKCSARMTDLAALIDEPSSLPIRISGKNMRD